MAFTIETVGQALDYLSKFPRDTRIVKSETFADGYTEILIPTPTLYRIIETDGLIVADDKVVIDSTCSHYRDAKGDAAGSFNAVVL